jgi:DNA-binding response OmpR family regulator
MESRMSLGRILVVEDDSAIRRGLVDCLRFGGFEPVEAPDGKAGLEKALALDLHLVLLDLLMPRMDGLSMLRELRAAKPHVPVIILTAKGEEEDKVRGLKAGADDYVVKPFSLPELTARVRAALRRAPSQRRQTTLQSGDLRIDLAARRVYRAGAEVRMTNREFDLLAVLVQNRGAVLTRDLLLSKIWGDDFDGDARTIDVHVRWLREKIEADPSHPVRLQTVRGMGYRFD